MLLQAHPSGCKQHAFCGEVHFVENTLWELSVTLCRGYHCIIAMYAALNARMTGSAFIPGLPVPTADAGAVDAM